MPENNVEDVPLGEIVENVSSYLKKFSHFKKYEKDIKKKYQKYYKTTEALPDCWSHDFINKAWRKTKTMHEYSGRRKCWSLAILFQVMKRSRGYDENETEAQSDVKKESPQSGGDPSANKPVYIRIPFSEMINGKECYRSDTDTNIVAMAKESKASETDEKNKESKASETDEKNKESKASETVAMDIIESPKNKEYKLIDKVPSPTQILQNQFYITLYDNQTRNAAWVYEILNESTLAFKKTDNNANNKADNNANNNANNKADNKANNKATWPKLFKKDKSVHEEFQAADGEKPYSDTGYDRGHLAAAANHNWCQQANDDTYRLSNTVPQQYNFNRGIWKTLEKLCRDIATENKEVRNVHVYTGPLYLSNDGESAGHNDQNKSYELDDENTAKKKRKMPVENIVGEKANNNYPNSEKRVEYKFVGGKAVPTHLFKVIIVENKDGEVLTPECYKIPNESPISTTEENVDIKRLKIQGQSTIEKGRSKLKEYKAKIKDIQRDSGLIFEEREEESKDNQRNSGLKEEITDATYKVQWRAKERVVWIEVKVSGSYTDHSDRAVLH